ncbi:MAG: CDP-glucose 4,6-dehydratase [Fimbriimonadaceae bacterium]|nr:CDP-glucose 4,6-dehydratase [Alphaproteobacteria bacterium]
MINTEFWKNRRVLLTGHTGFKGGWTSMWLSMTGAKVTGLALDPDTDPNFFDLTRLSADIEDCRGDITDRPAVQSAIDKSDPEIIIHMAAQSLVRRSYLDPVGTFNTNVLGTANVLDAARTAKSLRAIIVVTSDKSYENKEWIWPYRENDRLGGKDPYSNSKACTELVAQSFRDSYFSDDAASGAPHGARLATVRAGNVIGGGDWCENRLVPDLVRAFSKNEALDIRYPEAVRPWQHVLEPVRGYLMLAESLYRANDDKFASAWNFGPNASAEISVGDLISRIRSIWPEIMPPRIDGESHPKEAQFLRLDSTKANSWLNWHPVLDLETCLDLTAHWYRAWHENRNMQAVTQSQIETYCGLVADRTKDKSKK